jgi:hypothetical protein
LIIRARLNSFFNERDFSDIISSMRIKFVLCVLSYALLFATAADANWEYSARGGYYGDDGTRMTIALRGGMAFGSAKIENDLGTLNPEPYYYDPTLGIMTQSWCDNNGGCSGYEYIGLVNIADLPVNKKFSNFAWAGGMALGWRIGGSPQWRLEAEWSHIAESDYNSVPMFKGTAVSSEGYSLEIESGGVQSTVSTDVFSAMAYYDFFDGYQKPAGEFIPYIGFGMGYASSKTILNLYDAYGDLSSSDQMGDFAEDTGGAALRFYTSETTSGNAALSGALGGSYGISENIFIDFGLRLAWIPKVKWALNNSSVESPVGSKAKDVFSARNLLYGTASVGVRFEF